MKNSEIIHQRLFNQYLSRPVLSSPEEVVEWIGAVQAQDFFGSLWGISLRMKKAAESDVEKAVLDGKIIRTWPMRGTIHFVTAKDIKWMVRLLAPRILKKMTSYYKKADLKEQHFLKAKDILEEELQGRKNLTRPEIYELFEQNKIPTKSQSGLFVLQNLAMNGYICFGPRKDKQQTFVLLDEWAPRAKELGHDESLANLVFRYYVSHGPATIQDLMWWSGLTKAEVVEGLNMNKNKLIEEGIDGKTYYMYPQKIKAKESSEAFLLPAYDEYTIAYKERSELIKPTHARLISTGAGFWSTMILNGQVIGMWRRTLSKDIVNLEFQSAQRLTEKEKGLFEKAADNYGKFLNLKSQITYV